MSLLTLQRIRTSLATMRADSERVLAENYSITGDQAVEALKRSDDWFDEWIEIIKTKENGNV